MSRRERPRAKPSTISMPVCLKPWCPWWLSLMRKRWTAGPVAALLAAEAAFEAAIVSEHRRLNEEFYVQWLAHHVRAPVPIATVEIIDKPLRQPKTFRYFSRRTADYGSFTTQAEKLLIRAAEQGCDLSQSVVAHDYALYRINPTSNRQWINQGRLGEQICVLYRGFLVGRRRGYSPYRTWAELLRGCGLDNTITDPRSRLSLAPDPQLTDDQEPDFDEAVEMISKKRGRPSAYARVGAPLDVDPELYWWNLDRSFGVRIDALPAASGGIDPEVLYRQAQTMRPELRHWFVRSILPHLKEWDEHAEEFIPHVIQMDAWFSETMSRHRRGALYQSYGDVFFSLAFAQAIRRYRELSGLQWASLDQDAMVELAKAAHERGRGFNIAGDLAVRSPVIGGFESAVTSVVNQLRKTFADFSAEGAAVVSIFEDRMIGAVIRHSNPHDDPKAWLEAVEDCFIATEEFVAASRRIAADILARAIPGARHSLERFHNELQKTQVRFPMVYPDARMPEEMPIPLPVEPRPARVGVPPASHAGRLIEDKDAAQDERLEEMARRINHTLYLTNGIYHAFHALQNMYGLTDDELHKVYRILLAEPGNHIYMKGSMAGATYPSIRYHKQSLNERMGARDIAHAVYGVKYQHLLGLTFVEKSGLPMEEAVAQLNDDIFDELNECYVILRRYSTPAAGAPLGLTAEEIVIAIPTLFRLTRSGHVEAAFEWLLVHGYPIRRSEHRWYLSGLALSEEGWRLGQWRATQWAGWQSERGLDTFPVLNRRLWTLASVLDFYLPNLHRPDDSFAATYTLLGEWSKDSRSVHELPEQDEIHALRIVHTLADRIGIEPSVFLWGEYRANNFPQRTRRVLNFLNNARLDDFYRMGVMQATRIIAARELRREPFTAFSQLAETLEALEEQRHGPLSISELGTLPTGSAGASDRWARPRPRTHDRKHPRARIGSFANRPGAVASSVD